MIVAALFLVVLPHTVQGTAAAPRLERDVLYRTVDGVELRLDALVPPGDGPFPAVLLVHGGAWMHGDRSQMSELAELLVVHGFACFSNSYRLAPAHRWPAQIEDCRYALQFVRANAARFHVDPARFGALGPSAGGHLVEMLAVLDEARRPDDPDPVLRQSSRLSCVVPYFGPSVLTRGHDYDFDTLPPPELFPEGATDADYAAASPLTFVTADDPPFLLVHGDADDAVPVQHSKLMDERLRAAGVSSELCLVAGGGHGDFLASDPQGAYWKRTLAFLEERLAPRAPGK
jgi:acetyl esterase/lipase